MLELRVATPTQWVEGVLANFDGFLVDHAACERKASSTAMAFVVRYPDREALLQPLIALAREELEHFESVYRIMVERGLRLGPDTKDPYVRALLDQVRGGRDERLLDRLLVAGIVEARGCERFGLVAQALPAGPLKRFYGEITGSEARHHGLFARLAREYFPRDVIEDRSQALLDFEGEVVRGLALRPALH